MRVPSPSVPVSLPLRLVEALPCAPTWLDARSIQEVGRAGGSYLLFIHLSAPLALQRGPHAGARLPAGLYIYAGSAHGPGGLQARLTRHFRKDKRHRWHVDELTCAAAPAAAAAFPGASPSECDLVSALLAGGLCEVPVSGFGSSDCRSCPSHLLRVKVQD